MTRNAFSGVPGDSKCECADSGCKAHAGVSDCRQVATSILYRIDMQDKTGTAFCDACADDAFESGLFTTLDDEDDAEPDHDDTVLCCPDCERPNQFGELCASCDREHALLSNSDADYRDRD